MPSTAESVSQEAHNALTYVRVFDDDPQSSGEVASVFSSQGFRASAGAVSSGLGDALVRDRPGVVVLIDRGPNPRGTDEAVLKAKAAELGIPILVVVDDPSDPLALAGRLEGVDDWVDRRSLRSEAATRVARLLRRRGTPAGPPAREKAGSSVPIDSQFFALVVHDLRTPLNVIGLSLRMISQAIPKGDPELDEDLRFVEENFKQIERMLTQLSDYYRLFENEGQLTPTEFSPKRLVDELLEARAAKANARTGEVVLEDDPTCPAEVALDPYRARQAIHYALLNATTAGNGHPVRLRMRGGPDRWVIEARVDTAPPPSVKSTVLDPRSFERLCGFAAERRGMDLAIAAKVSLIFGGSARLDAVEGRSTTVVLDWPARLPGA